MPRVQIVRVLFFFFVAAEVNDYDNWTDYKLGVTRTHARWRLERTWR